MPNPAQPSPLLGKTARKWVVLVHVLSSMLWMGSAVAMMVLTFAKGSEPSNAAELYGFCLCIKLIDDFVIIASCGLSALSGILLGWKTPWGLFRYWWVVVKLAITLVLLAVGASLLGPWIDETERLVRAHGKTVTELPRYQTVERRVAVLGTVQLFVLGFIAYASILKPWGKLRSAQDM